MRINTLTLAKTVVMFGVGFWLFLAVVNNIMDMGTGLYFMKQMVTMDLLKSDPTLGKGLLWRAINTPFFPKIVMWMIIVIESVATIFLLFASFKLLQAMYKGKAFLEHAISVSNIALTIFICIWMWFLGGDLWFGFWIKSGNFVMVHSIWIIISLLLFIFVNYRPYME